MPAGYELVCFPKQIGSERRTVRATRLTRPGQQSYRQILVTAGPRHFWLDCWRTVVARSCACHRSQPADLSLSALDAGNVALGRRTVLGCIALWRGCGVRWSRADCYRRKGVAIKPGFYVGYGLALAAALAWAVFVILLQRQGSHATRRTPVYICLSGQTGSDRHTVRMARLTQSNMRPSHSAASITKLRANLRGARNSPTACLMKLLLAVSINIGRQ